jgi:uncharacterized protein (UPF0332 family)
MSIENLISKLKKEKKLLIVEPSKDISQAYMKKSLKSLKSSKVLFKIKNLEDSIALAYYSMYFALLSLLFRVGIKSENHTISIWLLRELFEIDNKPIKKAKKERIDKQYYVDSNVLEQEVKGMIRDTENFVTILFNFIETLKQDDIDLYRNKATKILS